MILILTVISTILFLIGSYILYWCLYYKKDLKNSKENLSELFETNVKLLSQKKSSEVLLGHIAEKLAPLTKAFSDYNVRDTIFLGMPIDYLCFGDNEITFLEVKSGKSQLTTKQKKIKNLVQEKKVKWDIIKISGDNK